MSSSSASSAAPGKDAEPRSFALWRLSPTPLPALVPYGTSYFHPQFGLANSAELGLLSDWDSVAASIGIQSPWWSARSPVDSESAAGLGAASAAAATAPVDSDQAAGAGASASAAEVEPKIEALASGAIRFRTPLCSIELPVHISGAGEWPRDGSGSCDGADTEADIIEAFVNGGLLPRRETSDAAEIDAEAAAWLEALSSELTRGAIDPLDDTRGGAANPDSQMLGGSSIPGLLGHATAYPYRFPDAALSFGRSLPKTSAPQTQPISLGSSERDPDVPGMSGAEDGALQAQASLSERDADALSGVAACAAEVVAPVALGDGMHPQGVTTLHETSNAAALPTIDGSYLQPKQSAEARSHRKRPRAPGEIHIAGHRACGSGGGAPITVQALMGATAAALVAARGDATPHSQYFDVMSRRQESAGSRVARDTVDRYTLLQLGRYRASALAAAATALAPVHVARSEAFVGPLIRSSAVQPEASSSALQSSRTLRPQSSTHFNFFEDGIRGGVDMGVGVAQPVRVVALPAARAVMDVHSHMTGNEVIGLLFGWTRRATVSLADNVSREVIEVLIAGALPGHPDPSSLAGSKTDRNTNTEIDPMTVFRLHNLARSELRASIVGWYHSHPFFPALPSVIDCEAQAQAQAGGEPLSRDTPQVCSALRTDTAHILRPTPGDYFYETVPSGPTRDARTLDAPSVHIAAIVSPYSPLSPGPAAVTNFFHTRAPPEKPAHEESPSSYPNLPVPMSLAVIQARQRPKFPSIVANDDIGIIEPFSFLPRAELDVIDALLKTHRAAPLPAHGPLVVEPAPAHIDVKEAVKEASPLPLPSPPSKKSSSRKKTALSSSKNAVRHRRLRDASAALLKTQVGVAATPAAPFSSPVLDAPTAEGPLFSYFPVFPLPETIPVPSASSAQSTDEFPSSSHGGVMAASASLGPESISAAPASLPSVSFSTLSAPAVVSGETLAPILRRSSRRATELPSVGLQMDATAKSGDCAVAVASVPPAYSSPRLRRLREEKVTVPSSVPPVSVSVKASTTLSARASVQSEVKVTPIPPRPQSSRKSSSPKRSRSRPRSRPSSSARDSRPPSSSHDPLVLSLRIPITSAPDLASLSRVSSSAGQMELLVAARLTPGGSRCDGHFSVRDPSPHIFPVNWIPSASLSAPSFCFRLSRAFVEPPLHLCSDKLSHSSVDSSVHNLLATWRKGLSATFPGAVGLATTPKGEEKLKSLQSRLLNHSSDLCYSRGFHLPTYSSALSRLEKRIEKVLALCGTRLAHAADGAAHPLTASLTGEDARRASDVLSRAAADAGCPVAGPYEKLVTRSRESHVWVRGDELSVTAGALARHRAAVAIIGRYGAGCSLLIALIIDVIEYYRAWGNRRDLVHGTWSLPPDIDVVQSLPLTGSSSAEQPPNVSVRLIDKLLASMRLWVPLLPLSPGPLRNALLRDVGAYVIAAWT
jgi:proteasome lid subunit RPN8/RPN11